jgi:hypothetical protein
MAWILILLYVCILAPYANGASSAYCRYPDLQAFPSPHRHTPINTDEYNINCLQYPTFNATIIDSALVVEDCVNAQFMIGGTSSWTQYSSPVPLKKGQNVFVRCDDSNPVMLVKPPTLEDILNNKGTPSPNPSVFVVMVDAVAYEALHRLMPNTASMLKSEAGMEVYEFTKYPSIIYLIILLTYHFWFYDSTHVRLSRFKFKSKQVCFIWQARLRDL